MFKHVVFRILAALVLLAAVAGIAGFAFNAGMARGAMLDLQAPAVAGQALPYYGHGMPLMYPPFFGFGFFGLLAPLFLLFLAFGAFRRMIWGARWGGHMSHAGMHHGPWGEKGPGSPDFIPPMFAEWHRRAHGGEEKPADPAAQK